MGEPILMQKINKSQIISTRNYRDDYTEPIHLNTSNQMIRLTGFSLISSYAYHAVLLTLDDNNTIFFCCH